tara:strand:- start:334 stop:690 length:357 start_codon:yes stop_codon:yes gene_type:complete
MSRFKRDFRKWLRRNEVKDVKAWLDKRGIKSFEALLAFCNGSDLHLTMTKEQCNDQFFQTHPSPPPAPIPTTPPKSSSEQKTWEIPAAERPLKKSSSRPKKQSPKRTKGSKSRKRSDK